MRVVCGRAARCATQVSVPHFVHMCGVSRVSFGTPNSQKPVGDAPSAATQFTPFPNLRWWDGRVYAEFAFGLSLGTISPVVTD